MKVISVLFLLFLASCSDQPQSKEYITRCINGHQYYDLESGSVLAVKLTDTGEPAFCGAKKSLLPVAHQSKEALLHRALEKLKKKKEEAEAQAMEEAKQVE